MSGRGGYPPIVETQRGRARAQQVPQRISASQIDVGSGDTVTTVLPTKGQKQALAGTVGTPGVTNRYVTETDPRKHASTHKDAGTDEIIDALDPRAYPMLAGTVAGRPAASVAGRFYWTTDEGILYRDDGAAWVKVAVRDLADAEGTRPPAYGVTNVTTDRSYDANATTVDELADVLGTLLDDLKVMGLLP